MASAKEEGRKPSESSMATGTSPARNVRSSTCSPAMCDGGVVSNH